MLAPTEHSSQLNRQESYLPDARLQNRVIHAIIFPSKIFEKRSLEEHI